MSDILHLRCPVCGKLSRPENFGRHQEFEALVEEIGGRGCIFWHRDLELSNHWEWLEWMIDRLRTIADRLEEELHGEDE